MTPVRSTGTCSWSAGGSPSTGSVRSRERCRRGCKSAKRRSSKPNGMRAGCWREPARRPRASWRALACWRRQRPKPPNGRERRQQRISHSATGTQTRSSPRPAERQTSCARRRGPRPRRSATRPGRAWPRSAKPPKANAQTSSSALSRRRPKSCDGRGACGALPSRDRRKRGAPTGRGAGQLRADRGRSTSSGGTGTRRGAGRR